MAGNHGRDKQCLKRLFSLATANWLLQETVNWKKSLKRLKEAGWRRKQGKNELEIMRGNLQQISEGIMLTSWNLKESEGVLSDT